MQTLDATSVDRVELDKLTAAVSDMPADSVLRAAISKIACAVESGTQAVVATALEQITPAKAARMLGVSRVHLYKLLDAGAMPFVHVGRDRRILVGNLLGYMVERERNAADFAKRMSRADADDAAAVRHLAGITEEDARRLGL